MRMYPFCSLPATVGFLKHLLSSGKCFQTETITLQWASLDEQKAFALTHLKVI